ncbi:MAG: hypothetical protein U1C04_14945 [Hydrogenophaga sp.]|nr:hypothetical protein [Hydrogenophaga sp.]
MDAGANRFDSQGGLELFDVHNQAAYRADGYSVNASLSGKLGDQSTAKTAEEKKSAAAPTGPGGSAGIGSDKGSAASVTSAAISGIAGDTQARTGDAGTGIAPIFDRERVKEEVNAQVAITAAFFQQAPKAWAEHAGQKQKEALARGDEVEAQRWGEGGTYRAAGHLLLGALGGGTSGAAGALASATVMPEIGKLIDDANLPAPVKQALGMVASTTLGALAGNTAGAAAAFGIDTHNRQLHPGERKLAQELAGKSGGRYTAEQIEEQMRLMGNLAFDAAPNSTEVLTKPEDIANNINQDPGMPKTSDSRVVVEVPGRADAAIQQFIIGNSTSGANYIPGQSPYIASNPALNQPKVTSDITPTAIPTAHCANGDLACLSGVGRQQNDPLTPAQQVAIGKYFGDASTTYQRAAALATATGNAPVALSFEIASGVAGLLEQAFLPSAGKVLIDNLIVDEAAKAVATRLNVPLPIVVEVVEREIKPRLQHARDAVDRIGAQ